MNTITYPSKERTEKKYTEEDVCASALRVIKELSKGQLTQICVNVLRNDNSLARFTTVELNEWVEKVVDDTLYYDGYKINPKQH